MSEWGLKPPTNLFFSYLAC